MFTGMALHLPGQELREFEVLRTSTRETANGRTVIGGEVLVGTIRAILAQATQKEMERWRQLQHPVTHKIIQQRTPPFEIKAGDVFRRDGRRFINAGKPYDVGDIHHFTIYYCDEREDA